MWCAHPALHWWEPLFFCSLNWCTRIYVDNFFLPLLFFFVGLPYLRCWHIQLHWRDLKSEIYITMLFFICHVDYKLIIVGREEQLPSSSRFSLHTMIPRDCRFKEFYEVEFWKLGFQRMKVGSRFAMATMKGLANGKFMMVAKRSTKLLGLWWGAKNYGDGVKKGRFS